MMLSLFGLKNCSTCVKAQKWLTQKEVAFTFVDVRQDPPSADQLHRWASQLTWNVLVNKKSQTWRTLTAEQQHVTEENQWIALVQAYPSLMKRPLLVSDTTCLAGFSEESYAQFIANTMST